MFVASAQLFLLVVISLFLNLILSFVLTWLFFKLAKKYKILDHSSSAPHRKTQKEAIPLLGGTGFVLSSCFFSGIFWLLRKNLIPEELNFFSIDLNLIAGELGLNLDVFKLFWIYIAIGILLIGGFLDDKYKFTSKVMIIPVLLSLVIVVFLGELKIRSLSAPFENLIPNVLIVQRLLALIWIGACMSATKFLDGHDGLVSMIGIIALSTIAYISGILEVFQPLLLIFSIIWAVGILGFIPWNLPDAKVYLGEGGSLIIGFIIGVLSILSGAKIATASVIMGWFILDILLVFFLRIKNGKNPLEGDRLHWNFRLQDAGISKTGVLVVTGAILLTSAYLGVALPTFYKILVFPLQAIFLLIIFYFTHNKKSESKNQDL